MEAHAAFDCPRLRSANVLERRAIVVRGIVQGVGFRPFVFGLARRLSLSGFVRNEAGSVEIEVEGDRNHLKDFLRELEECPPPLAEIVAIESRPARLIGERAFRIETSIAGTDRSISISPDVATCADCLAEMFDPENRRFQYPFINCTNCGPRLTIIESAPYDRSRTTMSRFAMCGDCSREYNDPSDRRFHAQPTCCPTCGPRLELCDRQGERIEIDDPLRYFADKLKHGAIGGLKGLGGYHLVCDARNSGAVSKLRRRKHRDEKPLAIMVGNLAAAEQLCYVNRKERNLLESSHRPIVLLRKRNDCERPVAAGVAPGNPYLGVMLPYTPLHHMLLNAVDDEPLVMTSGNRSDEPIAYEDDDAIRRLGRIADVFLRHDRPIHVRCDDSVTRCVNGEELVVRRSRGYAPQTIKLPVACERSILAVGGQFKGVFALASAGRAIISHHMGDLDQFEALRQFERDIALYEPLFQVSPEVIVHDLHPDYAPTNYAERRASAEGLRTLAVQHHHAHMASCMAENGLNEPVIGVTFDGTGYGIDETTNESVIWGGEFLIGDYWQFRRAAHFRYVPMPGGDKAAQEPWRMAAAHLMDAGCGLDLLEKRICAAICQTVETMLRRRFNAPLTSSAGRLFDAVASIAGVRDFSSYEGQAAMELEWLATEAAADSSYSFEIAWSSDDSKPSIVDTRPLIREAAAAVAQGVDPARIARRFHSTLVAVIRECCTAIAVQTGISAVVLSGGVFLNALLTREATRELSRAGLRVHRHRRVPPSDGGLSLGQVAIAAARFDLNQALASAGKEPARPTSCNLQPTTSD